MSSIPKEPKEKKRKKILPLNEQLQKLNIKNYEKHMLICAGPSCCAEQKGEEAWQELKRLCQDNNLTNGPVYRTKAACLRVCQQGPIGVVYPDGVWYKNLNKVNVKRVVEEHLIGDQPVKDLIIEKNSSFCKD